MIRYFIHIFVWYVKHIKMHLWKDDDPSKFCTVKIDEINRTYESISEVCVLNMETTLYTVHNAERAVIDAIRTHSLHTCFYSNEHNEFGRASTLHGRMSGK